MSNYHILSQSNDRWSIQLVDHYTVPAVAQNSVGILYTDIVKKCCDLTSQLPNHQTEFATEYQNMQDGKVIERAINFRFSSSDLTAAQKKAEIENGTVSGELGYIARKAKELARLAIEWEWYGYSGNVV